MGAPITFRGASAPRVGGKDAGRRRGKRLVQVGPRRQRLRLGWSSSSSLSTPRQRLLAFSAACSPSVPAITAAAVPTRPINGPRVGVNGRHRPLYKAAPPRHSLHAKLKLRHSPSPSHAILPHQATPMERFHGDGAAANGFGRRSLHVDEARAVPHPVRHAMSVEVGANRGRAAGPAGDRKSVV